ncbi:MAG: RNase H family protein [Gammaproteobacteria bacterium]
MTYEDALNIYSDGSSFSNPRRGGIGIRYITINEKGDEEYEDDAPMGYKEGTNNQMELMACILAIKGACNHWCLSTVNRVYIFTDSMYVRDNYSRAMYEWPKQKWCNKDGRPIDNCELWKDLVKQIKKVPVKVTFEWVKAHSKNQHNKAVDKLAKDSARGVLNPPLTVTAVRRKKTKQSVKRGCIKMEGQSFSIRIITDTYLRTQKIYKYKYEIISEDSKNFEDVDIIYSKHVMGAGHHYEVTVNEDSKNPLIVEVIQELERD